MDCRITDCKVVLREGSIASVPPNHFGDNERYDSYYGVIQKMIQNYEKARVKLCKDQTVSIEHVDGLCLDFDLLRWGLFVKTINQWLNMQSFSLHSIHSVTFPSFI